MAAKKTTKSKLKAAISRVKGALAGVKQRRAKKKAAAKAAKATAKTKAATKPKAKAPKRPKRLGHRPVAPRSKTATVAPRVAKAGNVREGGKVPSFALLDDEGQLFSSHALEGQPYVVYFYPKDDTPGCTKEACDFRDRLADFGRMGVSVIGISPDSVNSHARFKDKYGLPYKLLSDEDRKLAKAFGVWVKKQNYGREYMGIERSTFLVGPDGKIKKVWRGVKVPGHVDKVLELARQA